MFKIIFFFLATLAFGNTVYDYTPITTNTDPDYVSGTYQEWLDGQPAIQPFEVTQIAKTGTRGTEFMLIFEVGITDSLGTELLNQWMDDIANQGLSVEAVEVTYSTHVEMKDYLTDLWESGLEGAVLVGDLPAAWGAMGQQFTDSDETFPSDYYYMDLDGIWEDNWVGYPYEGIPGADGVFDTWSGNLEPEIYVGRIKLDNLTAYFPEPMELLRDYLERNHQWRLNGDPEPLTALCYVDDDWSYWGGGYQGAMEYLYPDVVLVSQVDSTNGTDYLNNRLPDNYVWISPYVHSGPTVHQWSPGPSTYWNQIVPALPQAHFYNLFACSNARFTSQRNMGAVYTFCTDTGLGTIGSTKSGSMLQFTMFYLPLGIGGSLGEAYQEWWDYIAINGLSFDEKAWHLGMVLLGDPTLIPAMHMLGIEEGVEPDSPKILLTIEGNPCRSTAVIVANVQSGIVEVRDTAGRLILSGELADGRMTVYAEGLSNGMYFVRVISGESEATEPLLVLK